MATDPAGTVGRGVARRRDRRPAPAGSPTQVGEARGEADEGHLRGRPLRASSTTSSRPDPGQPRPPRRGPGRRRPPGSRRGVGVRRPAPRRRRHRGHGLGDQVVGVGHVGVGDDRDRCAAPTTTSSTPCRPCPGAAPRPARARPGVVPSSATRAPSPRRLDRAGARSRHEAASVTPAASERARAPGSPSPARRGVSPCTQIDVALELEHGAVDGARPGPSTARDTARPATSSGSVDDRPGGAGGAPATRRRDRRDRRTPRWPRPCPRVGPRRRPRDPAGASSTRSVVAAQRRRCTAAGRRLVLGHPVVERAVGLDVARPRCRMRGPRRRARRSARRRAGGQLGRRRPPWAGGRTRRGRRRRDGRRRRRRGAPRPPESWPAWCRSSPAWTPQAMLALVTRSRRRPSSPVGRRPPRRRRR